MAASGIAEHNEARRKEMLCQKIAFKRKILADGIHHRIGNNPELVGMTEQEPFRDTYEEEVNQIRKVGSPPGFGGRVPHDAAFVDRQRREELRKQQLVEYNAKIPNRYSSIDYIAQW